MSKLNDKKLYRIFDANFNRAKEGLRVCEDICRFILNKKELTRSFKNQRHQLTKIIQALGFKRALDARDINGDVGRGSVKAELKRKNLNDIFYANTQRTKESVRVLEEFSKLVDNKLTKDLKKVRYKIYDLEKRAVGRR